MRRAFFSIFLSFLMTFLLIAPSVHAASSQFIIKGSTSEKIVALTFDDGSDGTNFNKILDILTKNNVKATFFLTGAGANNHPQIIKKAVSSGHDIGNHSFDHPDFTTISTSEMTSQLSRTETIVKNLTNKSTKPFFRAPYGATNASTLSTVGNAGYTYTLHWTIDSIDWTGNSSTDITNRVLNNIVPGSIILMHTGAGASGTPSALEKIIPSLKNMGYRFVTISQLLGITGNPTLPNTGQATYTVRSGDTLYAIALRFNSTVQQLTQLNSITNPNLIRVGQVLKVPGGSTPTTPTAPTAPTTTYTVKSGDTLYAIALRYNTTVQKLVQLNNIANSNLIRVGQVLKISNSGGGNSSTPPATTTYTVKSGDTLYAIALRYNTTVQQLVSWNKISNPNLIRVGQQLRVR
ncbi:MAG TPA: LysM peptidoglycan-binding domain-containing protein [Candidatus Jeotgalibaca pullicola]|uniref:LysM peptidoglycan-binding domain-containing protein n=2 Tax=Jeotgalibaca ciconiae TaxID=2496265 RepID=A0A3Q9BP08_9LACT|nr:LysM peptidoglycan-binding domain-containing protein [Jeotgalibaca ciconiae]HJB22616.1 LysM peptidoglycan-binding domain-containing protein [Candidatus Jeotgalibaca pullicola]